MLLPWGDIPEAIIAPQEEAVAGVVLADHNTALWRRTRMQWLSPPIGGLVRPYFARLPGIDTHTLQPDKAEVT